MKKLAIIPARGGSKGIKNKNTRIINGQPLVSYTIDFLKNSKLFDRIIVTTDSLSITKIAQKKGIEVPFIRPKRLSGDLVNTVDVIKHSLSYLKDKENYEPDIVMIFQPTTPIRSKQHILEAVNILSKNKSATVVTVSAVKQHPNSSFKLKNNKLVPFNKNFDKFSLRQKVEPLYHPNGSLYAFGLDTLVNYNSIYGTKIFPIVIEEPEYNIDIDKPFDLFISEMSIKYWKKYKKNLTKK